MISSAVPPLMPLEPPSVAGGTAEAPNSSKARTGASDTGRARTEPTPSSSRKDTIQMPNIQQPSDSAADAAVTMTPEQLESLISLAYDRGYHAAARAGV